MLLLIGGKSRAAGNATYAHVNGKKIQYSCVRFNVASWIGENILLMETKSPILLFDYAQYSHLASFLKGSSIDVFRVFWHASFEKVLLMPLH